MPADPAPSARRQELLELAYAYVLEHGLGDVSLRPLAAAVGSSPRVLLFLFGSKDRLVRALLGRARAEELELLARLSRTEGRVENVGLGAAGREVWEWLAAPDHRALLVLWVEGYGRSLVDPAGPWADFATASVHDWLEVLATSQSARDDVGSVAQRTQVLALLRGALLDLLATGDVERITGAVHLQLQALENAATDGL